MAAWAPRVCRSSARTYLDSLFCCLFPSEVTGAGCRHLPAGGTSQRREGSRQWPFSFARVFPTGCGDAAFLPGPEPSEQVRSKKCGGHRRWPAGLRGGRVWGGGSPLG